MNVKDWPVGFRFRYNSPYTKHNKYDRVIIRVGTDPVSDKITPEFYLKNKSTSNICIVSTKNIIFKLCEIDIELPGEFIKKERNKKLKKIGIK